MGDIGNKVPQELIPAKVKRFLKIGKMLKNRLPSTVQHWREADRVKTATEKELEFMRQYVQTANANKDKIASSIKSIFGQ